MGYKRRITKNMCYLLLAGLIGIAALGGGSYFAIQFCSYKDLTDTYENDKFLFSGFNLVVV